MEKSKSLDTCINCGKSDNEAPILQMKFRGAQMWICSGCIPVLIHRPEQLMGQLTSVNNIEINNHA